MTRRFSFQIIYLTRIAILLFGTIPAFSQDKAPASPIPVLKTQVRLVVLDVLVTDSHGKPIPNLKAEAFNLTEGGTPQTIKTLEDHTAVPAAASTGTVSPTPTEKPLTAGTYSNRPKLQSNMWNVILIDLLNTPAQAQIITRRALKEFASHLPTGAPVALLVMSSSSVKVLVPFTPNGVEISKLLDGDALFSTQSPVLDTYNADDEAQLEQALSHAKNSNNIAESYRETEMDRLQMRVEQTLQSLDGVAAWLGRLPGRKNLYWLSAGFPLSAEPQTLRNGVDDRASERWLQSYALLQHETDTRLEAARVAVFPLDVRGNQGSFEGIDTADVQGSLYAKPGGGIRYSDDVNQAIQRLNSEHAEMEEIAEQTGGIARYNRNDLDKQLSDQFGQAQTYYTLSYSPTDKNWNGKYRKINLKLKDSSYHLYYRRGYFADTPPPTPSSAADAFTLAMRYGAAPSTSVLFNVRLDKNTPGKVGIHYAIDTHTLKLVDAPDNHKSAKVNCAVVEYDGAGAVLGTTTIQVAAAIRPDQMPLVESSGFPATQQVPLLPNAKWLAIGVQDANTDSFGTLQLAVDPPTPALTPASATTK
jgi:VWFA-related protein